MTTMKPSAKAVKAAKSGKSAKSAKSAKSVEAAKSAKSVEAAKSAKAAKPGRTGKAGKNAATGPDRTVATAYHHGDLRRALLDATEKLLESEGVEGFTLREVARRAGVSHGAPAHHFGDVRGLLSEFTAESFAQLSAAMRHRRARASSAAFEQLVASGIGYVEYAITNRARFQLMFLSDRLDPSRPSLAEAAADAFSQLVECIDRVAREVGAPSELDSDKVALAWSIVHGFATLLIDNKGFALRVSGNSRTRALETLKRLIESNRPAFEQRE